jgi:hypothetical protein
MLPPLRQPVRHLGRLLRSIPHELGTARALENLERQRRDVDEINRTIDAIAVRITPPAPAVRHVA